MTALSVHNLTVHTAAKRRLNQLSFDVSAGDRLAIVGPNGAGKSTALQALLQLIPSTHDDISYFGRSIQHLSRKEMAKFVAYVPQAHPHLSVSVWDWCVYSRSPYQRFGFFLTQDEYDIIHEILSLTKLMHYKDTPLSELSGGEKQRVFIAGALCQETPMIFLDEPTNFLDPKQAHDVLQLILDVSTQLNKTIVSVTHDINEVTHYFTHCLAIKTGEKLFFGPIDEVIHADNLYKLYDYRFTEATTDQGVIFW